ncbi:hypothetical protein BH10PLA2_BH10PLA2_12870 [soil metagenome]
MKTTDQPWLQQVQRLFAAYAAGGREALGKLTPIETHVLYSEKHAARRIAGKQLSENPACELSQLRVAKLDAEINDIAGWLKEEQRKLRDHEKGRGPDR